MRAIGSGARAGRPPDLARRVSRALFLDRDGVLNANVAEGRYVESAEGWRLLPGVGEALREVRRRDPDVRLIVVTNQRGVALGQVTETALQEIHERMRAELAQSGAALDGIYICPHEVGTCDCRKPLAGLFRLALADFPDIDPADSCMVGDSLADLEAGHSFGCRLFLVGDADRRANARARAEAAGIAIEAEAVSLEALVRVHPIPALERRTLTGSAA